MQIKPLPILDTYLIPFTDDILISVQGSTFFGKLDLNSAFHQLASSTTSCSITIFPTDMRIKCYKRFIFRVNSVQDKLQHTLRQIISSKKGIRNILIYAKKKEHVQILEKVLLQIDSISITLNLKKHLFSTNGLFSVVICFL